MGRPKAVKPIVSEPKTPPEQTALESQPSDPPATISKAEAVRRAIAAGKETPGDGVAFIKDTFGIEMTKQMWSSYVSQAKSKANKATGTTPKAKPGRKPKATSPAVTSHAAPGAKHRGNGEGDLLETLEALKPLIAHHGADRVKRLVDLLG